MFSEKATKNWQNLHRQFDCRMEGENFVNFLASLEKINCISNAILPKSIPLHIFSEQNDLKL